MLGKAPLFVAAMAAILCGMFTDPASSVAPHGSFDLVSRVPLGDEGVFTISKILQYGRVELKRLLGGTTTSDFTISS
jgi:hypothetical protein